MGYWSVDVPNLRRIPRPIQPKDILRVDIDGEPYAASAQDLADALGALVSPPAPGGGPFTWTPSSLSSEQFWSQVGLFASHNALALIGVEELIYNGVAKREGIDIQNAPDLAAFRSPNLIAITDAGYFYVASCPNLTAVALPKLAACEKVFYCGDNPTLASLDLSSVTTFGGDFYCEGNPTLASLDLSSVTTFGGDFYCDGNATLADLDLSSVTTLGLGFDCESNALTESCVNTLLAMLVASTSDGSTPWAGAADFSGGTNAAPTAGPPDGIAAAAALVARGATVTTN